MDKFRAIRYFTSVAEKGGFSAAARALEVTTPAVTKLINALERELGCPLLQRHSRGASVTPDGAAFFAHCRRILDELAAAEMEASPARRRPSGVLRVAMYPLIAQHCVMPALPRFHVRYPDVHIELQMGFAPHDAAQDTDIYVVFGWPSPANSILRRCAQTRFVVCASPTYWAQAGTPRVPRDLEHHECILYRQPHGTLLDRWAFEKDGETQSVVARGFLTGSDRNAELEAAIAGAGVVRIPDLVVQRQLTDGSLVPVLLDWYATEAPPINLLYRPGVRRLPRVRAFVEFAIDLFRDLEANRLPAPGRVAHEPRPTWVTSRVGRSSASRGGSARTPSARPR